MHISIDRTVHTTAFDKPVVDHWFMKRRNTSNFFFLLLLLINFLITNSPYLSSTLTLAFICPFLQVQIMVMLTLDYIFLLNIFDCKLLHV